MTARTVHRHPFRGLFAGLLLGLGVVLMVFVYGALPMTVLNLALFVIGGAVLGVVLAYVTPPRHRGAPPPAYG